MKKGKFQKQLLAIILDITMSSSKMENLEIQGKKITAQLSQKTEEKMDNPDQKSLS